MDRVRAMSKDLEHYITTKNGLISITGGILSEPSITMNAVWGVCPAKL